MRSVSVVNTNSPNKKNRSVAGSGKSSKSIGKETMSQTANKCSSDACVATWKPLGGIANAHKVD